MNIKRWLLKEENSMYFLQLRVWDDVKPGREWGVRAGSREAEYLPSVANRKIEFVKTLTAETGAKWYGVWSA